jgi:GT2 family glycosyltransferase
MNISFISAFNTDKNIGGEYNRLISKIPDEYIFIKDGDSIFLSIDYGNKISKIINDNPDFDIIGCMTNRIRNNRQRVCDIKEEPDINKHINLANIFWECYNSEVISTNDYVAAFCIIIKRKVWEQVKFESNTKLFDINFCRDALKLGFKIGIAKGLYVFHLYRWGHENPEFYNKHLE